jgi:uncharacterized phage protein (TIGR02220 family)
MARARNIKPGFFANEELVELPFATRLLFIGLWTIADREGRLEDKPKRIKMVLFPADNIDVDEALCELAAKKFILRYSVDGIQYIQILAFKKHQNPHKDEKASSIPEPQMHHASTVQTPCKHHGNPADSLIPDSSITTLSDSDESNIAIPKFKDAKAKATHLLEFLNSKTNRSYRPVTANLSLIQARLKEYSFEDLKAMVAKKSREWGRDETMNEYLRPATLFNATKCAQYIGELVKVETHE